MSERTFAVRFVRVIRMAVSFSRQNFEYCARICELTHSWTGLPAASGDPST